MPATLPGELIREYTTGAGVKHTVDRERGIIKGVKILGHVSKNGRRYSEQAMKKAISLYEGAKVNVDHPPVDDPHKPRGYADRLGRMQEVTLRPGDGLYGDFHFNPKHALAEQLCWDAENAPENVGFSHNVRASSKREGSNVVVEEIHHVNSVDLVADPATTSGLFESELHTETEEPAMQFGEITLESLAQNRPDLVKSILEQQQASAEAKAQAAKLATLEAENKQLREQSEKATRVAKLRALIVEAKLPEPGSEEGKSIFTDGVIAALEGASEAGAKAILEGLSAAYGQRESGARSVDAHTFEGGQAKPASEQHAESFAEGLRRPMARTASSGGWR